MNRTHLAAFHAVADAGSFIRGAERLHVGQPAVSSHVANLEAALKVALFERLARGVRLTEAGTVLLGYARRIETLEQDAEHAIAELRGLATGTLRIGASTTVGAYLLPRLIGQFKKRYPGVQVALDIGNAAETQRRLLDALLDFSVTEGLVDHDNLSAEQVFRDELVAIASPTHPFVRQRGLTAKKLTQAPVMMREVGSGTREVVERALAKKRAVPRDLTTIGSTEAIKQSVIAGLGVAIVSRMTIELELASGALRVLDITDLSITRPILLTLVNGRPLNAAANAFLPMLRAASKKSS